MQTFLPHPDFGRSARALDAKRLGKQRVECLQVVRGLTLADYGWRRSGADESVAGSAGGVEVADHPVEQRRGAL